MTTRILIIDPDIPFVVSLKQALEGTGEFTVSVSATGPAAEETLQSVRHDVAVIDFDLPELDVMELIADLRHIQPDLPIIMTPRTEMQHERARFLAIQRVLPKPYLARDLIPHVRGVISRLNARSESPDDFVPPAMPATLRHLMPDPQTDQHPTPSPTELLDDVEREKLSAASAPPVDDGSPDEPEAILREFEEFEQHQGRYRNDTYDEYGTKPLDESQQLPSQTKTLPGWDSLPETTQLSDTRELDQQATAGGTMRFDDQGSAEQEPGDWAGPDDDDVLMAHGWVAQGPGTRVFDSLLEEPPTQEEDTPTVPPQDLPGVRQFLATDQQDHDPTEFGEVLDAVAQSPPRARALSPDDEAFNQLVDSMRAPEERRNRRRWLEDLLASIAADTPGSGDQASGPGSETDFDEMLEAMWGDPGAGVDLDGSLRGEVDDPTLRDVIHDLFDPSFEHVLEALAGKDIDDEADLEPGYLGASQNSLDFKEDTPLALEDLPGERDAPEWLKAYEAEGLDPVELSWPEELPDEPPVEDTDSSRYPATTALHAVSRSEASEDLSLNELLGQIETELPQPHSDRPQLKPLPSWGESSPLPAEQSLESLFDRFESASPDESSAFEPSAAGPTRDRAGITERAGAAPDEREAPSGAGELDKLLEAMDTLDTWQDAGGELTDTFAEPEPAVGDLNALFDAMEEAGAWQEDPGARAAWDAADDADDDAIAAAFYAGVRSESELTFTPEDQEPDTPFQEAEAFEEAIVLEDAEEWELAPESGETPARAGAWDEAPGWEALEEIAPIDEEHLIPVPLEAAARLLSQDQPVPAPDEEDEAALAQIAVQLTQYSLESSAQATMLSRPGVMLAGAGDLPDSAMQRLFNIVDHAWQTRSDDSDSLMRFVTLPEAGDFLMYSKLVSGNMILSMVFHLNTAVRVIRRQARRLSESLAVVPDADEVPAAEVPTTPTRPTESRRPPGWRVGDDVRIVDEAGVLQQPGSQEDVDLGMTCLWLPRDPGQELGGDFAYDLHAWVDEIALEHGWRVDDVEIDTDFIAVSLFVSQKMAPDEVITHLMDETTHRAAALYPHLVDGYQPLWADGYYLVMPPRALTEREIARFITYQRQAQIG